jgi:hypothetical protein
VRVRAGEAEARSVAAETSGRTSSIEQVFGIRMRQRMQGLQGAKAVLEKEIRCFQVIAKPGLPTSRSTGARHGRVTTLSGDVFRG